MIPLYRNVAIAGGLLGALLLLAPSARLRGYAPLLVSVAVTAGLVLGFLIPADLLHLPAWTGLQLESAAIVCWVLYGLAARRAPRPWLPGPPVLTAWLAGALFGELAGAALVAAPAKDRGQAARLAMAAAAGGLVGRVGDPTLLALGDRVQTSWLLPLSAMLLLLARPTGPVEPGGSRGVTALGLGVAVGTALLTAWSPLVLLGGAVVLLGLGRGALAWRELLWGLSSVALALVAAIAGVWEAAAESAEWLASNWGSLPLGLVALAAGLGSFLIDGPAAGLSSAALLDRAMDLSSPGVPVALAVGAAVGGAGPLVMAGAFRAGWRRWLLGVALAAAYAAALSPWLRQE